MMKNRILFLICFAFLVNDPAKVIAQNNKNSSTKPYNPRYWLEGVTDYNKNAPNTAPAAVEKMINDISNKGWGGVLYWGASRNNEKINYYYKSPYLEKQSWATQVSDNLTPLVNAAKKKGVKVMVNIEGVNPYHWENSKWTPATIKAAASDLAATGIDAVFEECFEVKPDVFLSLARELKSKNVDYISGTDPMLLRESYFANLWPETGTINLYNYYLKRDKLYNIAALAQHGSLGLGWAKYWNKPTSLISPVNRNWGIDNQYTPAVVTYLCMIRALQFRLDNFILFGGSVIDPIKTQEWIGSYVKKQEERPTMNIVVLLDKRPEAGGEAAGSTWNRFFNSGDALTSGAFNAGYNIVVSDKVVPADAYWIYTTGGLNDNLPQEVVSLFSTNKPVFIQAATSVPSAKSLTNSWKAVLEKCGVNGDVPFIYAGGTESHLASSLPEDQSIEVPYTGYYNNTYLRFTGSDNQRGQDLRAGTVIPKSAITGTVYSAPNRTYGKGPYIVGTNNKYLVTTTTLNWEVAYPISNLLSGGGILPSSNVWGIAGENVSALLAIETTELNMKIPNLKDGEKIHVVVWDKLKNKISDETVTYKAPFTKNLKEYDLILIDKVN